MGVRGAVAAAALLLASAGLQLGASLQRWSVSAPSWARTDHGVEDHLFDYSFPADPWENLGASAELFGAGTLLLASAIVVIARFVPGERRAARYVLVAVAAASFGVIGLHALASGLADRPSLAQYVQIPVQWLLGLAGAVALLALAVILARHSRTSAVACLLLLGTTLPGYIVAAFVIAPSIADYQSYDTTPWTETVLAAWTGLAGIAMVVAACLAARRSRATRLTMTQGHGVAST